MGKRGRKPKLEDSVREEEVMSLEEPTDPMSSRCIIDVRPKDEFRRYGEPNPHFGTVQADDLKIEFICSAHEHAPVTVDGYDIEPQLAGYPPEDAREILKEQRICLHKGKLYVTPARPEVTVSGGPFTYDGNAHGATAEVTGVDGADISGLGSVSLAYVPGGGTVPTDAGSYQVIATFTPEPGSNYSSASGTGSIEIDPAQPQVTMTGGTFTYDGYAHGAAATVTGVKEADLSYSGKISFGYTQNNTAVGDPINAGTYQATATFTPDPGSNYSGASGSAWITINPAQPTLTVNGGPATYDGKPHRAKAYVTAAGRDISKSGALTFSYTTIPAGNPVDVPIKPGTYAAIVNFSSNSNYTAAYGSGLVTIYPPAPINGSSRAVVELQKAITGVNDELIDLKPVTMRSLSELSHAVSGVIRDIEIHKETLETAAPDDFYRVLGKVVKDDQAIPGVLVEMKNAKTQQIEQAYTDRNGTYDFLLREGSYQLSAAGKSTTISVPGSDS
jgi:hypothetical protein